MTSRFLLQYARPEDLQQFTALVNQDEAMFEIYLDDNNDELPSQTQQKFNLSAKFIRDEGCLLLLKDGSTIVGFSEIHLPKNTETDDAQLYSLFIKETHRAKGLASALIANAMTFMQKKNFEKIYVLPTAAAFAVYIKFGFYPSYLNDQNAITTWLKQDRTLRLEQLQDVPSNCLNLDLTLPICSKINKKACIDSQSQDIQIDDELRNDLFNARSQNFLIQSTSLKRPVDDEQLCLDKHVCQKPKIYN